MWSPPIFKTYLPRYIPVEIAAGRMCWAGPSACPALPCLACCLAMEGRSPVGAARSMKSGCSTPLSQVIRLSRQRQRRRRRFVRGPVSRDVPSGSTPKRSRHLFVVAAQDTPHTGGTGLTRWRSSPTSASRWPLPVPSHRRLIKAGFS